MRKFALFSGIALLLVLLALFIAPQFIPAEVYKEQVIRKVGATTGRDIRIDGPIGLRFLPNVQLTLEDVHLSNPKGFSSTKDNDMASLRELRLSLGVWALLQGRVNIDTFKLVDPVILLAHDAKGNPNWVFTPAETAAENPASPQEASEGSSFSGDLQLPNLEITNGTVTYLASPKDKPLTLSQLNGKISLPSLTTAMVLEGETLWNGTLPVTLQATLTTPRSWMDGKESAYSLHLAMKNDLAVLDAQGNVTPAASEAASPVANGEMTLAVASLKKLGNALEMPLLAEDAKGEGKLDLRGSFTYADPTLDFPALTLALDNTTLSGKAGVKLGGARPAITAELATKDVLVVDDYLTKPAPTVKPPADEPKAATGVNAAGWSTEPVLADTSALKAVDATIALALGGIKYDTFSVGAIRMQAALKNGSLNINVPDFGFYGGKASATASIQAVDAHTLALSKNATLTGADIGKFLREMYDFNRLDGTGDMTLAFSTRGISVSDFVHHLNGKGDVLLKNGAIRGFNLADVVRNARTLVQNVKNKDFTADMRKGASPDEVKTDFSSLSGSYTIANGLLANRDLKLLAPLLTVTGEGTVDIPKKTVDYRLKPTIVGSLEGEGRDAQATSGGLTVPVRVTGTFDTLKFNPDTGALIQDAIKDPKGTVENLEKNFKGLKGDVKSLLKGF